DRDLFQLVDDKRKVNVVYLAKGITNHDHVDIKWIADKYDIPGERYALFAMIRGDASDGLPGIRGIGEKGAAVIAKQFTTLEEVMKAAASDDERLTPNARKKLLESSAYAEIAPKLVFCALDVPLPNLDLSVPKRPKNLDEIYQYQKDYGLGASVDRFIAALGW
ncbi:MAG: 5'-3' exonuclease H3TH domain-containing protein, partial [Candidatus Nanopelagicaceae bacterium]